jgi:predicted membrane protein
METNVHNRLSPQLVLGLCAIGFGILLTLDNLDLMRFHDVWRFWPAVLIVVGVMQILWADRTSGLGSGAVLAAVGAVLLLGNLHILRFSLWNYWPLILVAIGASIAWQALERGHDPSTSARDLVTGFAFMSGVVRSCNSQSFRGGDLTAIMGGCEIDLRQASITADGAAINALAFWGGVEIKIPEDWNVQSSVIPLLGGFEDKTRPPREASTKTLFLKGFAIMGGIEVRN